MSRKDSSNLPAMPWFASDYEQDTWQISPEADLLYRRLLDVFWRSKCRLRFDPKVLRTVIRLESDWWSERWPEVAPFWDIDADGWMHNARAEHEWGFVTDKVAKRRAASKKANETRWNREKAPASDAPIPPNGPPNGDAVGCPPGLPPTPTPTPTHIDPPDGGSPPNPPKGGRVRAKPTKAQLLAMDVPDGIPPDVWHAWVEHRVAIRKPLGIQAAPASLRTLAEWAAQGLDVRRAVEHCIASGWQSLNPPRDQHKAINGQRPPTAREEALSALEQFKRERAATNGESPDGRTIEH